jgi:hypothetical protein
MKTKPHLLILLRASILFSAMLISWQLKASENVPHAPFAEWANVLPEGQFNFGLNYQQSEAYYIWDAGNRYNVTWDAKGERYGIDITQGWLTFQYGITERWSADLAVGYTTVGWRYFSNFSTNGDPQSTSGLMDTAIGVRYQIWSENLTNHDWRPTLTFRAGGILPGSFDQYFPFAPGLRSAAIEPELLARKHFGWPGLGVYFDGLFRYNMTSANDQYIIAVGLFQKIKSWDLDLGYRHLGSINGQSIQFDPNTRYIVYPRSIRENNDSFDAGFSYTAKNRWKFGFFSRTVFDGANTDKKFALGGYMEIPFGGKEEKN